MFDAELPHVVAVAGDPGGANALAPVLRLLREEGRCTLSVYAYRQALAIWQKGEIACVAIAAVDNPIRRLEERPASLLLTATSCNGEDWEKVFLAAARHLNIPSLTLLDFWSNYLVRFTDRDGGLQVPDRIAVMDDAAAEEMAALGIDRASLVVTGQPAFDALPDIQASFAGPARESLRRRLAGSGKLVAFVSQPLSTLYRALMGNPRYLGYDEDSVLEALCGALAELAGDRVISLCILPHPSENPERFSGVEAKGVAVQVVENVSPHEVLMSADVVVGMTSMLLVEACMLGCPVVSLQPGLKGDDVLPTNRSGASVPVYSAEGVVATLAGMLADREVRQTTQRRLATWRPQPGAAQRVADLVYRMSKGVST